MGSVVVCSLDSIENSKTPVMAQSHNRRFNGAERKDAKRNSQENLDKAVGQTVYWQSSQNQRSSKISRSHLSQERFNTETDIRHSESIETIGSRSSMDRKMMQNTRRRSNEL